MLISLLVVIPFDIPNGYTLINIKYLLLDWLLDIFKRLLEFVTAICIARYLRAG